MMFPRLFPLLILFSLPVFGDARVFRGTLTLPSYEEGAPDPNPPAAIYPYTLRSGLAGAKERKSWRTVEIENEFLKCTILPDLGGRVYSCIDKIGKHDLFYANPVIRKSAGGPRGIEMAAGVEYESPVSPGLVTLSPVDCAWRQNADGSAAVFTGNTGRDGTRWLVELILRPGRAVLEQHITVSNPDAVRHSFTWWERASVPAFEDTRFYLPAYLTTDASGEDLQPWDGKLARIGASRRFAYRSREGAFAVYSAREGSGTAHWANPKVFSGKGFGYRGPEAIKNLTDDGSQFVEMEPGLFGDPGTSGWLEPGQTREFTEFWMPLRKLGGFSSGNSDVAVFLEHGSSGVTLALEAFRALPNARFVVTQSEDVLLDERTSLDPVRILTRTMGNAKATGKLRFQIQDEKGKIILEYTEGFWDAAREVRAAAEGQDPPGSGDAGLDEGRRAVMTGRFAEAIPLLEKAAPIPETRLYLGLAFTYLGDDGKARGLLGMSPEDRMFGVPSRIELAKLLGRTGDRKAALGELQAAFKVRAGLAGATALEVALLRVNRMEKEASQKLAHLQARDPADPILRFEAAKLGAPGDDLWKDMAGDPARVLQVAEFYLGAGLWEDALEVLGHNYPEVSVLEREPGTVLPQDDPLVSYERGFARIKMGGSGSEDFALASKQHARAVFPNRPVTMLALKAALKANAKDETARSLLAAVPARMPEPGGKTSTVRKKSATTGGVAMKGSPEERAAVALGYLERGRLKDAAEVFTESNFPMERQSEAVKAAFLEVRLQRILEMARLKRCGIVPAAIDTIGDEAKDVPFSMYGFGAILKTARVQYLLADAEATCGEDKAARKWLGRAAKAGERASGIESAYGKLAAWKLGGKVAVDPSQFSKDVEGLYALGLLQRAAGQKVEATENFRTASEQSRGNAMLHYLCELALTGR